MFLSIFFCSFLLSSNLPINVQASELDTKEELQLEVVDEEVIVKLKKGKENMFKEFLNELNLASMIIDMYENYFLLAIDSVKDSGLINQLKSNEAVEYVEANSIGEKSGVVIDPLSQEQDYMYESNAFEAWDLVTDEMKRNEIIIGVIDTGINSKHEDLEGSIDTSLGYNFVNKTKDTNDNNGHGTNVAGIIVASNNGKGINGISSIINTKIIPVKVLDEEGIGTTLNIANGIRYAADKGANIINISINGKGYSQVIDDAIQYAISKGIIIVSSAGNDGGEAEKYWPNNSNGVIVASDNSSKANKGNRIDVQINPSGLTTGIKSNEHYEKVYGTSMSSAIVTATVALMKSQKENYTAEEVISKLKESGSESKDNKINLDIKKTLERDERLFEIVTPIAGTLTDGMVEVRIKVFNPENLSYINIDINGEGGSYQTIEGNGEQEYIATIKYEDLINGTNSVEVECVFNGVDSYKHERYFQSVNNSNVLTLVIKDTNGETLKNRQVLLGDSEVNTDEKGVAKFFNIKADQINEILIFNEVTEDGRLSYYKIYKSGTGRSVVELNNNNIEVVNYNKPSIEIIENDISAYKYNFSIKLNNNMNINNLVDFNSLTFDLIDPQGTDLQKDKDFEIKRVGEYNNFSVKINKKIDGEYKLSISKNILGNKITSNVIIIKKYEENIEEGRDVDLKIVPPSEFSKKFKNKNSRVEINYYIYNKETKKTLFSKDENKLIKDFEENILKIDKAFIKEDNRINIKVTIGESGGFILDRDLAGNSVLIDANSEPIKKLKIENNTGLRIKNIMLGIGLNGENSDSFIYNKVKDLENINIWVDSNIEYSTSIIGKNLALYNSGIISDANEAIVLSDSIGKLKINSTTGYSKKIILNINDKGENIELDLEQSNLKDYINISADYEISELRFSVRDSSQWIGGSSCEYRFESKFSVLKDTNKIVDLDSLEIIYSNNSWVSPQSIYKTEITVSNSDLNLKDFSSNTGSGYANEAHIYRNTGKLEKIAKIGSYSGNEVTIDIKGIKAGMYMGKLNLVGLNVIDTGFFLGIYGDSLVTLRIMDPFEPTKPIEGANVYQSDNINTNSKLTDRNGYITLNTRNFSSSNEDVTVSYYRNGERIIFTIKYGDYFGREEVTVPVLDLKKVDVSPQKRYGTVSLDNKVLNLAIEKGFIQAQLNSEGKTSIYTNRNFSNINISNENYYVESEYNGEDEVILNNEDLGKLIIEDKNNKSKSVVFSKNDKIEFRTTKKGVYYMPYGEYDYKFECDNGVIQKNKEVVIEKGIDSVISFKSISTLEISTDNNIGTDAEYDYKKYSIFIEPKDELGNIIEITEKLYYIFEKDGVESNKDYFDRYTNVDGKIKATAYVDYKLEDFNIIVGVDSVDDNVKSNKLNLTMKVDDYKAINVKDPLNKGIKKGQLINERISNGTNIRGFSDIFLGYTYVKKTNYNDNMTFDVWAETSSGELVLYGDRKVNAQGELEVPVTKKIPFTLNIPDDFIDYRGIFQITKKIDESTNYRKSIVFESYNDWFGNSHFDKYKNRQIYVDSEDYTFLNQLKRDSDYKVNYYSVAKSNENTTEVILELDNMMRVNVDKTNGDKLSNLRVRIGFDVINVFETDYISKNVFNQYSFTIEPTSGEMKNYYNELDNTMDSDDNIYEIKYGEPVTVHAKTDDKISGLDRNKVSAKLNYKDEYGNSMVYMGENGKVYISKTIDGVNKGEELISNKIDYDGKYFNVISDVDNRFTSLDVSYKVIKNGKELITNTISYNQTNSVYKIINVKDPLGNKFVNGKIVNGGDIFNGVAFLPKNIELNKKFDIEGTNEAGDEIFYYDYWIDDNTEEIRDETMKLYTFNFDASSFGSIGYSKFRLLIDSNGDDKVDKEIFYNNRMTEPFKVFLKECKNTMISEIYSGDNIYINSSFVSKDIEDTTITKKEGSKLIIDSKDKEVASFIYSLDTNEYILKNIKQNVYFSGQNFKIPKVNIKEPTLKVEDTVIINQSDIYNEDKIIKIGENRIYDYRVNRLAKGKKPIEELKITDEYGNEHINTSPRNDKYVIKEIDGERRWEFTDLVPSAVNPGIYNLEKIVDFNGENEKRILVENVELINYAKTIYETSKIGSYLSYKFSHGDRVIESKENLHGKNSMVFGPEVVVYNEIYNLKKIIGNKTGNMYKIDHTENEIEDTLSGMKTTDKTDSVNCIIKNNNIKSLSIYSDDGLKLENIPINNEAVNLNLIKDMSYKIEAIVKTKRGLELQTTEFVASDKKEINFTSNNVNKIEFKNSFISGGDIGNIKIETSNNKEFSINNISEETHIYLPKDEYSISFNVIAYDIGVMEYSKNINLNEDILLEFGKNLTFDVGVDKAIYKANNEIKVSLINLKDTNGQSKYPLNDYIQNNKVDIINGNTTIKTIDPESKLNNLKGEVKIRGIGTHKIFGDLDTGNIVVNIDNPNNILDGDINLDNIVDIFDFSYISKDIGLKRDDELFDPRVNLDNSNDIIDIIDLSKAAVNYNKTN